MAATKHLPLSPIASNPGPSHRCPRTFPSHPTQSCLLRAGKDAIRPYTPVSAPGQVGTLDLVVKKYSPGAAVGGYLDEVPVGGSVSIKGPIFKFVYEPNTWSAVGMIAGGSGITPMYQLIQAILANPRDKTEVRLIYANRTPGDILLKKELDALAATHPNFKVLYTVDAIPAGQEAGYSGAKGIVTADMVRSFLPGPDPHHRVFVCGPGGMMNHLSGSKKSPTDQGPLTGLLADLKYTPETVYKY